MNESERDTKDLTSNLSKTAEMRRTLWIRRQAVSITMLALWTKVKFVLSVALMDIGETQAEAKEESDPDPANTVQSVVEWCQE